MPPKEFVRRRVVSLHELQNRIQSLDIACPSSEHRNDATKAICCHEVAITEPRHDSFSETLVLYQGFKEAYQLV
jgi:hypothetical protein